jgi:hypothetical protein
MGKGYEPPPAPDPEVVAKAQTASNIETATAQQKLNMINTHGPQGSVVYGVDPTAPGGYSQTTSLSPTEQKTYDLSKQAENGALGVANDQLGRVGQALATPLSTEGLPVLHGGYNLGAGEGVQGTFNKGNPLQYGFNPGQAVQGQVGGDLEAARKAAEQAVYSQAASRLDPRFEQSESQLRTQLQNQGLSENSDAFQTALGNFGREKTDAYNQAQYSAIGAGEQAAQAQFARQLGQGQFANDAAAQMYGQNLGQAQFHNATASQDYTQNMGAAEFANQAQNQQFNQKLARAQLANTARNQGLQERAYLQNQPINQFTALLGSGQVGMPQGVSYTPSQVASTDVIGAHALKSQAEQAAANRSAQQGSGLMGGLFSLGSAAIMASDERLKINITRVGALPSGIPLHEFEYVWGGGPRVGVIAQEVQRVRPEAVVDLGGFLAVDYTRLSEAA